MTNPFHSLARLLDSLEADFNKFYGEHNQGAGTRLRRGLKELKSQAVQIRREVQQAKEQRAGGAPSSTIGLGLSTPKIAVRERGELLRLSDNCFEAVVESFTHDRYTVHTHFTDAQAVAICSKMADSHARQLAKEYAAGAHQVRGRVLRYQLHLLATRALQLYGGAVLSFLLKLRPLRFRDAVSQAVRYQLLPTETTIGVDFPALTFRTVKGDEFTLAFHLVPEVASWTRHPVQIFRNRQHVGSINSRGAVLDSHDEPVSRIARTNPRLLIFCDFLRESPNPAFYCGVETGTCYLCGRPLTDLTSVRYGIGPVCLGKVTH